MPERYILDKALKHDTLYRSEPDIYYAVERVGTDSTSKAKLEVDGSTVLEITNTIARPHPTDANRFPPLDLQKNYIVIPPDKTFKYTGESGKIMRLLGWLFVLAPGEAMVPAHASRFTEQPRKYYTYKSGTWTPTSGGTLEVKEEQTVVDETCAAGERWRFDRYLYVERKNALKDKTFRNIGLRMYVDDKPLDNIDPDKAPIGLDSNAGDYCVDATHYYMPVALEQAPIALEPGRNVKIKIRNISDAGIAYTATIQVGLILVTQRELV